MIVYSLVNFYYFKDQEFTNLLRHPKAYHSDTVLDVSSSMSTRIDWVIRGARVRFERTAYSVMSGVL